MQNATMGEKTSDETNHVGVRMPVDLIEKMNTLAKSHHRSQSGEIIHACSLYIAAHEPPSTPEAYYAALQALEFLRAKMLDDLKELEQKAPLKRARIGGEWIP